MTPDEIRAAIEAAGLKLTAEEYRSLDIEARALKMYNNLLRYYDRGDPETLLQICRRVAEKNFDRLEINFARVESPAREHSSIFDTGAYDRGCSGPPPSSGLPDRPPDFG